MGDPDSPRHGDIKPCSQTSHREDVAGGLQWLLGRAGCPARWPDWEASQGSGSSEPVALVTATEAGNASLLERLTDGLVLVGPCSARAWNPVQSSG